MEKQSDIVDVRVLIEMINTASVESGSATDDAMRLITLGE